MFKNKTVTMTMQTGLDPKEGLTAQALVSKFCFCAKHRVLGTHAHPWLMHSDVRRKLPQYCKALSLQLNKLIKKDQVSPFAVCYLKLSQHC